MTFFITAIFNSKGNCGYYNHKKFQERKEREKLIEEIAERVLSRISATVDVSEIIDQIEELRRIIDDLGN